ncbi:MAG: carbonic anhydrase family protein, partial [Calditrichia bacterium]
TTIDGVTISAESMLPTSRLEYRYSGSLTTPPCSEGVQWLVLKDSIEMSAAQIAAFAPILNHNNRPLQPVNARNIISNQ